MPDLDLGFATLGCSGDPLDQVLGVVERHGITGIELRVADDELFHLGLSDVEAAAIGARLRNSGIRSIALSSYVRLCRPDDDDTDQLADLRRHLDLGRTVGASGVRTFMADPDPHPDKGFSDGERRALDRLAEAEPFARESGVAIMIETHDSHTRADELVPIMTELDRRVPGATTRILWDTAHSWSHGEDLAMSWDRLAPWLGHLQVKDERSIDEAVPCMLGDGTFPIAALMALVNQHGYTGLVSLEWERKWHPHLPDIDTALDALPAWLGLPTSA